MDDTEVLSRLHMLLSSSLALWGAGDEVVPTREDDAFLLRLPGNAAIVVTSAPVEMREIMRWSVAYPTGRIRRCSSILGVLDAVRDALGCHSDDAMGIRIGVTGVVS